MAEQKTVVHDQAWFDATFRLIRTAPQAQAEVELRCLIRDVGTAAMTRAMRSWLEVKGKLEKPPVQAPRAAPRAPQRPSQSWAQGIREVCGG